VSGREGSPPAWPSETRQWKKLKPAARALRREATAAETILWEKLRNGQIDGHRFRRQPAIGPFVVDFCCWKKRLIIEVDGGVHLAQTEQDRTRQEHLQSREYRVLRFSNDEVEHSLETVVRTIGEALSITPSPEPRAGWARH
jgi:very-short-patch-repair endonuclease